MDAVSMVGVVWVAKGLAVNDEGQVTAFIVGLVAMFNKITKGAVPEVVLEHCFRMLF
jgi:hypothetical protein